MDEERGASTIHASKGGGGAGKWLAGGLAAVVLLGGGYLAWKNFVPGQSQTQGEAQTAYNDQYNTEPTQSAPLPSDQNATSPSASASDSAAAPAATTSSSTHRTTTAHATPARAQPVPEETIGITPVNATVQETPGYNSDEEVNVVPPQRPVWARTPDAQRLTAYYPEHAREVGREGEASLHCTVQLGGALACSQVSEFPARAGFGAAAMNVARGFRHASQRADGSDAAGTPVNLRVVFRMQQPTRQG